jgi:hypothetical protein
MVGGIRNRTLKTIITFDYVNEPGIHVATEWESPALESFYEKQIDSRDITKLEKSTIAKNLATESYMIFNEISWIKDLDYSLKQEEKPPFTKW